MSEEKKPQETQVSEQKRNALIRYLAIMFAVAFALVLLSYLIQASNSQSTIDQLSATSSSALQNAAQLQDTNWALTQEIEELNEELDNATVAVLEYQESVEAEKNASYQEGLEKGREEGAAQTRKAYTLMAQALEEKNPEALKKILDELEPIKNNLSQDAQKEYDALIQQYNALNGNE